MSVEIKIDAPDVIAGRIFTRQVKLFMGQEAARMMDPYVPMDSGPLSKKYTVDADGITYNSPYAAFQYYGQLMVGNQTGRVWAKKDESKHAIAVPLHYSHDMHPLATSHWDEPAMRARGEDLARAVQLYIKRRG